MNNILSIYIHTYTYPVPCFSPHGLRLFALTPINNLQHLLNYTHSFSASRFLSGGFFFLVGISFWIYGFFIYGYYFGKKRKASNKALEFI